MDGPFRSSVFADEVPRKANENQNVSGEHEQGERGVTEGEFHLMAPDSNSPTRPCPQEGRVLPGGAELVRPSRGSSFQHRAWVSTEHQ